MSTFVEQYAVEFISVVLAVLALLFLTLIIYVVIRRYILNRRIQKFKHSEERIVPVLLEYVEGERSRLEVSEMFESRFDIVTAFRNINLMIENLVGEERKRLKSLLMLTEFKGYFLKKLRSNSTMHIAQACMYFEKKNITDKRVVSRLEKIQTHPYSVLAYASTLALINVSDQKVRDEALEVFIKRKNNASMAISDVIYKYHTNHQNKDEAADVLFRHITDPEVVPKTVVPILRMFGELHFFQLEAGLLDYLKSPLSHDHHGLIKSALIELLTEFSSEKLAGEIKRQETWRSQFQNERLATARWAKQNYDESLYPVLVELASDSDLEVRIEAQVALLQSKKTAEIESAIREPYLNEWLEIKEAGVKYAGLG